MLITRAPFATAQRIAFASASTGIERCGPTTFAISSSAGGASPAMPTPSSVSAAIRPATKVPCPCVSTVGGPLTKLFAAAIRLCSSGWCPVDSGVDHGNAHGRERRRLRPGVEGSVLRGVPLAVEERVVRDVGRATARQRFDVSLPRQAAQRARAVRRDREGVDRREVGDRRRAPSLELSRERGSIGARAPRRRRTGPHPRPMRAKAEHNDPCEGYRPRDHFAGPAGTVIVRAGPACPSAVSR